MSRTIAHRGPAAENANRRQTRSAVLDPSLPLELSPRKVPLSEPQPTFAHGLVDNRQPECHFEQQLILGAGFPASHWPFVFQRIC